jgi:hypothetical protein
MGGGFLQLAAYGVENLYLNGNPQTSFFVSVFKRHTNFSIENCRQYFSGTLNFGKKVVCTVNRIGDLMNEVFLVVKLPSLEPYFKNGKKYYWVNSIGHALIRNIEIEIGGKVIDTHSGLWMSIWSSLTTSFDKDIGYGGMIGRTFLNTKYYDHIGELKLYIPLFFWFCKNIGSSLPLVALQKHEVKINLNINNISKLIISDDGNYQCGKPDISNINDINIEDLFLYVDYIYLDDKEKKFFAQNEHDYLIEQIQMNQSVLYNRGKMNTTNGTVVNCPSETSTDPTEPGCAPIITDHLIELNFSHPIKEFIWIFQNEEVLIPNDSGKYGGNEWFNYAVKNLCKNDKLIDETPDLTLVDAVLYIEGKQRIEQRDGKYFKNVVPYQRHSNIPERQIYVYSFALNPESLQPTGTCNYSEIDNSHFIFNINDNLVNPFCTIFGINYNVLRIKKGMAGVAYF